MGIFASLHAMASALTLDLLLSALVRSMRVFAFVTGALVIIDSIDVLFAAHEHPPHRPKANAVGWMIVSFCACVAAAYLLSHGVIWADERDPPMARTMETLLWFGIGAGFTQRACTRAQRPRIRLAAALSFCIAAAFLALLVPAQ